MTPVMVHQVVIGPSDSAIALVVAGVVVALLVWGALERRRQRAYDEYRAMHEERRARVKKAIDG